MKKYRNKARLKTGREICKSCNSMSDVKRLRWLCPSFADYNILSLCWAGTTPCTKFSLEDMPQTITSNILGTPTQSSFCFHIFTQLHLRSSMKNSLFTGLASVHLLNRWERFHNALIQYPSLLLNQNQIADATNFLCLLIWPIPLMKFSQSLTFFVAL